MDLEDIEIAILAAVPEGHPCIEAALRDQLDGLEVKARDFTNGGGVFVDLAPKSSATVIPRELERRFDGPWILSDELACGASAMLVFDDAGLLDHVEIWCHANDYPVDRHPQRWRIEWRPHNHVDLRDQP